MKVNVQWNGNPKDQPVIIDAETGKLVRYVTRVLIEFKAQEPPRIELEMYGNFGIDMQSVDLYREGRAIL